MNKTVIEAIDAIHADPDLIQKTEKVILQGGYDKRPAATRIRNKAILGTIFLLAVLMAAFLLNHWGSVFPDSVRTPVAESESVHPELNNGMGNDTVVNVEALPNNIDGWDIPIKDLEWGMNGSEILHALGLTEDAVIVESFENYSRIYPAMNMNIYGFSVPVSLQVDNMIGLARIGADFSQTDLEQVQTTLEEQFGDWEGSWSWDIDGLVYMKWEGVRIENIDLVVQRKLLDFYDFVLEGGDSDGPISFEEMLMGSPYIRCSLSLDHRQESYGWFWLEGRYPAMVNTVE